MKKRLTFAWLILFACFSSLAQVQIDKQIQLTGSGSSAKVSGIDEVSQPKDATSAQVVQKGGLNYAAATGTGDAITVALSPAPSSYSTGMIVNFKASAPNTGPASIAVNGLGAVDIKKEVINDLAADDIKNGQMVSVIYDGSFFQLMFQSGSSGGGGLPVGTCITTLNPVPPSGYTNTGSYFVSTAGWAEKSIPNGSSDSRCMAVYNNRIYMIGGFPYGTNDLVDEYDPATNTWTAKASMLSGRGRGFSAAATVNGKIYVFGGQNSSGHINYVDEYDPATNTWATKTSLPTSRRFLAAAAVNNKIYVIGGGNYSPTASVEEYDPSTDSWTVKNDMPFAMEYMTAIVYNNLIYTFGGSNGVAPLNEASTYNPATDTWASLAPTPVSTAFSGSAINNKFYLFAGTKSFEYDPATDAYITKTPPLNSVSYYIPAVTVNNKIYVSSGNSYNMEYDPTDDRTMYIHCP